MLESEASLRFHMPIGVQRPLARAAMGRALLSLKSDFEIRLLMRRINAEGALEDHVKEARVVMCRLRAACLQYRLRMVSSTIAESYRSDSNNPLDPVGRWN
jgi:DNA-binding IclR family transcriptional regulator